MARASVQARDARSARRVCGPGGGAGRVGGAECVGGLIGVSFRGCGALRPGPDGMRGAGGAVSAPGAAGRARGLHPSRARDGEAVPRAEAEAGAGRGRSHTYARDRGRAVPVAGAVKPHPGRAGHRGVRRWWCGVHRRLRPQWACVSRVYGVSGPAVRGRVRAGMPGPDGSVVGVAVDVALDEVVGSVAELGAEVEGAFGGGGEVGAGVDAAAGAGPGEVAPGGVVEFDVFFGGGGGFGEGVEWLGTVWVQSRVSSPRKRRAAWLSAAIRVVVPQGYSGLSPGAGSSPFGGGEVVHGAEAGAAPGGDRLGAVGVADRAEGADGVVGVLVVPGGDQGVELGDGAGEQQLDPGVEVEAAVVGEGGGLRGLQDAEVGVVEELRGGLVLVAEGGGGGQDLVGGLPVGGGVGVAGVLGRGQFEAGGVLVGVGRGQAQLRGEELLDGEDAFVAGGRRTRRRWGRWAGCQRVGSVSSWGVLAGR